MDQSDIDLLQTLPDYHLQALVKIRHVPLSPLVLKNIVNSGSAAATPLTPAVAQDIATHLFDVSAIQEVLQELSETTMLVLRELVLCGGRANSRDLALYFSSTNLLNTDTKNDAVLVSREPLRNVYAGLLIQPPQYPPALPHGVFELALRHLLMQGLLFWGKQTNFAGRDYSSGMHDGVLVVPLAVREAARQWLPLAEEKVELRAESDVGDGVRALQRALYLYWSLVASQREGFPLVTNGLLARSALRSVVEHIGNKSESRGNQSGEQIRVETDAPYVLFLRLLLLHLGLLQERNNVLYALSAEEYFSLPLIERARRCYRLYAETPFWNDILYLPDVNVRPGPTPLEPTHEDAFQARQTVVKRVLHERQDAWCTLPTFIARTRLYAPYLLFPRQYGPRAERYSSASNPYGWDFRLRRGWLTHREGWHMVEGGFIRAVVAGPLRWLGVVDFESEDPTVFRLAPGVAYLSDAEPAVHVDIPAGRLIVQPNFELVALAPVSEALLVSLDRFAERVSLEHIAQYRLTRSGVTRAVQHGLHAESIQAVLERAAEGEIPQNVRYSLVEWERQARRVEMWPRATLLEVGDSVLLDTLFADTETRALFGRRLSALIVEVVPQQLRAVQEMLWQRNYLPALTVADQDTHTEEAQGVREPQWRLHENGLLQPCYAVLDLYLVAQATRFSEQDAATGWLCLTPSSVHQALEAGRILEEILNFFQHYCADGIPGSLLIQLKLWGGGYAAQADIHVEQAPLLRLSADILQDIQSDTELNALLGSEIEPQVRLVRVDPHNLERVLDLLRERGFTPE